jgi:hypothetical protein
VTRAGSFEISGATLRIVSVQQGGSVRVALQCDLAESYDATGETVCL